MPKKTINGVRGTISASNAKGKKWKFTPDSGKGVVEKAQGEGKKDQEAQERSR